MSLLVNIFRKNENISFQNNRAVKKALIEIVVYIFFLITGTIVALSARHLYMFYLNQTVERIFLMRDTVNAATTEFEKLATTADMWNYFEGSFLKALHHSDDINNTAKSNNNINNDNNNNNNKKNSFLHDNVFLGAPRIRQIRVRSDTCFIHNAFLQYFNACYAGYDNDFEDKRSIYKGTKFYTLDELDARSLWGQIETYDGAGYVEHLTFNEETNREIFNRLKRDEWVDRGTRLVLLEFALYNANTDLFCNVKIIIEHPPTGGVLPSTQIQAFKVYTVWTSNNLVYFIAAIIFYLLLFYYTIEEVIEMIFMGPLKYISSMWNLIDITILMLSYLTLAYSIWHISYLNGLLALIKSKEDKIQTLDHVCYWNLVNLDIFAICVFLLWIKIFKYLRFNRTLLHFSTTLKRCAKDLLGFGAMFGIVFLAYAQLGLLLFGTNHTDFKNYKESVLTMLRMVLGDFNYKEIERANRILGPIFFLTYILLVFFILLNMFLAIINDTYSAIKKEIKYEDSRLGQFIVDIVRKIFCCFKKIEKPKPTKLRNRKLTATNESDASTSSRSDQPRTRLHRSEVLRDFFEDVKRTKSDRQQVKQLNERLTLMEDVLEHLIHDMDEILRNVKKNKRI